MILWRDFSCIYEKTMRVFIISFSTLLAAIVVLNSTAQSVTYPFRVKYIEVKIQDTVARMAYMDEVPTKKINGKTALFFHGKNFNGYYWKEPMTFLRNMGYRVISVDQVGWGRSDKPVVNYSFDMLAANTIQLLDSLDIQKVLLISHSMGGMLATRFTLNYPNRVEKLVLENPIGLEDYKKFVPQQPLDSLFQKELNATYTSYKKYQQSYYPKWKPEYEQYVKAQAEALNKKDFKNTAYVNALTYQMILEQPVVQDFNRIRVPTLLIIGQEDRTVVGKDRLPKTEIDKYGNYPALGRLAQQLIPGSKLIELAEVGHIPHIQTPELYKKHLLAFLSK